MSGESSLTKDVVHNYSPSQLESKGDGLDCLSSRRVSHRLDKTECLSVLKPARTNVEVAKRRPIQSKASWACLHVKFGPWTLPRRNRFGRSSLFRCVDGGAEIYRPSPVKIVTSVMASRDP